MRMCFSLSLSLSLSANKRVCLLECSSAIFASFALCVALSLLLLSLVAFCVATIVSFVYIFYLFTMTKM